MKVIEVKEFDPGSGNEYVAASYPGQGVYFVPRMGAYYAMFNGCACMVCLPPSAGKIHKEIEESKPLEVFAEAGAVKPASDTAEVIRALNLPLMFAAAMHSGAAVELAKKGGV